MRRWFLKGYVRFLVLRNSARLSSDGGQDLIEYSLMAGLLTVAVAAAIPYTVKEPISKIYSTILDLLVNRLNPDAN